MNLADAQPVRVWDLPTRVFHWLLALVVTGSIVSAKLGGAAMLWHLRFGMLAMALLLFRIVWGLVGGRWSRFSSFAFGPAALGRYLRGKSRDEELHDVAHSPLAALSVFAMLTLLGAQVASGLLADDEIATQGPLVRFVSGATSSQMTHWHKGPGQRLVIALLLLHIAAILFYRAARGRRLVGPMLHGDKLLPPHVPASADNAATRALAAVLGLGALGVAGWVWSLGT